MAIKNIIGDGYHIGIAMPLKSNKKNIQKNKMEKGKQPISCVVCGYGVKNRLVAHDAGFKYYSKKRNPVCYDCQKEIAKNVVESY